MSITISDIMKLPSMHGAKVVAGHEGMQQVISAISVLESADEKQLGIDFEGISHNYGQEIIITAFMAAKDDVEQQCATLRRVHQEGEVGVIVFYVGSILLHIDQKLITQADELGIPLIVMPEKQLELRYSDVISEVIEAIINDRQKNTYFTTEVIERISHLEDSRRSISTVLSIIRDRTQCSLYLYDELGRILNSAEWPHGRGLPATELYTQRIDDGQVLEFLLQDNAYYVAWETIESSDSKLILMVVKEKDDLTSDCCKQIKYIVKTYIHLWAEHYGRLDTRQLVSAIIHNEPEKMRQIAAILKQNVKALSCSYFLYYRDGEFAYNKLMEARTIVQNFLSVYQNTFLMDLFDETVVIFADRTRERIDGDLPLLLRELSEQGLGDWGAVVHENTPTPEEVKAAYWRYQKHKKYLPQVFVHKCIVTGGEVSFVERAVNILEQQGGSDIRLQRFQNHFFTERREADLTETLETFLLDADANVARTAELLFLHKNTIKSRIKSIETALGHRITRMPEIGDLYMEAVLNRLKRTL